MRIESVKLQLTEPDYPGFGADWSCGERNFPRTTLRKQNLILGKNASGKSSFINLLHRAQRIIDSAEVCEADKRLLKGYRCEMSFRGDDISGKLIVDGGRRLLLKLQSPDQEFSFPRLNTGWDGRLSKIDPRFSKVLDWVRRITLFSFGTALRKSGYVVPIPYSRAYRKGNRANRIWEYQEALIANGCDPVLVTESGSILTNDTNYGSTGALGCLYFGLNVAGEEFKKKIIADMEVLGYAIRDFWFASQIPPSSFYSLVDETYRDDRISGKLRYLSLVVQEKNTKDWYYHGHLSQGMFRALSFISALHYFLLVNESAGCFMVDDVGEGLDYDRSLTLIKLICDRFSGKEHQLIMTTNDRYTMNSVPIEDIMVIDTRRDKTRIHNYENSKGRFDRFSRFGLSNFDFFATHSYDKRKTEVVK